jgi:hypothetical protein
MGTAPKDSGPLLLPGSACEPRTAVRRGCRIRTHPISPPRAQRAPRNGDIDPDSPACSADASVSWRPGARRGRCRGPPRSGRSCCDGRPAATPAAARRPAAPAGCSARLRPAGHSPVLRARSGSPAAKACRPTRATHPSPTHATRLPRHHISHGPWHRGCNARRAWWVGAPGDSSICRGSP